MISKKNQTKTKWEQTKIKLQTHSLSYKIKNLDKKLQLTKSNLKKFYTILFIDCSNDGIWMVSFKI